MRTKKASLEVKLRVDMIKQIYNPDFVVTPINTPPLRSAAAHALYMKGSRHLNKTLSKPGKRFRKLTQKPGSAGKVRV